MSGWRALLLVLALLVWPVVGHGAEKPGLVITAFGRNTADVVIANPSDRPVQIRAGTVLAPSASTNAQRVILAKDETLPAGGKAVRVPAYCLDRTKDWPTEKVAFHVAEPSERADIGDTKHLLGVAQRLAANAIADLGVLTLGRPTRDREWATQSVIWRIIGAPPESQQVTDIRDKYFDDARKLLLTTYMTALSDASMKAGRGPYGKEYEKELIIARVTDSPDQRLAALDRTVNCVLLLHALPADAQAASAIHREESILRLTAENWVGHRMEISDMQSGAFQGVSVVDVGGLTPDDVVAKVSRAPQCLTIMIGHIANGSWIVPKGEVPSASWVSLSGPAAVWHLGCETMACAVPKGNYPVFMTHSALTYREAIRMARTIATLVSGTGGTSLRKLLFELQHFGTGVGVVRNDHNERIIATRFRREKGAM